MAAEAAYYRALARGFQGGDPVENWLQAEQVISKQFLTGIPESQTAVI
jgi:hypothetical protein